MTTLWGKRWAMGLVATAALLAPVAPARAAVVTDAAKAACGPTGSAAACKAYLYKQCFDAQKKQGATDAQAKLRCGG